MSEFIKMTANKNIVEYENLIKDQRDQKKAHIEYHRNYTYLPSKILHYDPFNAIADKKIADYRQAIRDEKDMLSRYHEKQGQKENNDAPVYNWKSRALKAENSLTFLQESKKLEKNLEKSCSKRVEQEHHLCYNCKGQMCLSKHIWYCISCLTDRAMGAENQLSVLKHTQKLDEDNVKILRIDRDFWQEKSKGEERKNLRLEKEVRGYEEKNTPLYLPDANLVKAVRDDRTHWRNKAEGLELSLSKDIVVKKKMYKELEQQKEESEKLYVDNSLKTSLLMEIRGIMNPRTHTPGAKLNKIANLIHNSGFVNDTCDFGIPNLSTQVSTLETENAELIEDNIRRVKTEVKIRELIQNHYSENFWRLNTKAMIRKISNLINYNGDITGGLSSDK